MSSELDVKTLHYGPVSKYFNKNLWIEHLEWYRANGYKVYSFNAEQWYTIDDVFSDIHEIFSFPGYFGRNWGAVDDCITDIDTGENGKVLVSIENFDIWYGEDANNAHIFLEVLATRTYRSLVHGRKFVNIIHSNNPKLNVRDVGAHSVYWNWAEWN
ncbi:barstar family protein [Aliikangiella sp. IMCC44359]|uniref:barstar family protein n=1 Tax=Aliikangiella sp. IMCC44359 TaxID=3459125 RepID=UPI00403A833A